MAFSVWVSLAQCSPGTVQTWLAPARWQGFHGTHPWPAERHAFLVCVQVAGNLRIAKDTRRKQGLSALLEASRGGGLTMCCSLLLSGVGPQIYARLTRVQVQQQQQLVLKREQPSTPTPPHACPSLTLQVLLKLQAANNLQRALK